VKTTRNTVTSWRWRCITLHKSLTLSIPPAHHIPVRSTGIPKSLLILGVPSDYFPLNLYVKISSCFTRSTCSGHPVRLYINVLLPQYQKLPSPLRFETLQFMFFVSSDTDGTSTDILYTVIRTFGQALIWVLVDCLNADCL
jgi:hypothetical protein